MGKILVVAEKPSVGKDIARVLKCNKKGDGCLIGDKYIVSWAIGHLIELCTPEEYDIKYKKWSTETLPIVPEAIKLKPIKTTKEQFNILKKLMNSKEIDYIICATDSGREGELIFRYIYQYTNCKKQFKRLWISSMTDQAINDGFANLKDSKYYDNLYLSAKCRSEADWLVGINASRAYTLKYNSLLSIGRVQTPTLSILVQRQKEINAFIPKDYWEVQGVFEKYSGTWFDIKTKDTKIDKVEIANDISKKVLNQIGTIISIEDEQKKQVPPLLYDLTELQRDGNKKFGFSAQKTLTIAQDLYEKRKLITYPRTDSRYLSNDMISKIKSTLNKINISQYSNYLNYIFSLKELPITKRIVDDTKITDHHAIIPTDVKPNLNSLTPDELKIYDLVVRRFICVFYPNYIYTITKVITQVQNENFISKGTTIKQYGWMELYKSDISKNNKDKNDKDKKEEQVLPPLNKGEQYTVTESKVLAKKTTPPKNYTEATLLSAMENAGKLLEDESLKEQMKNSGLGTPATRASIIERLLKVGYIERKGKSIIPTEKGMKLTEIVPNELRSAETTGKWEKGLNSIAEGKMVPKRFMDSIIRYVNYIIIESNKVNSEIVFPEEPAQINNKYKIVKCPLCNQGSILENTKAFYCTNWKSGCKFNIWKSSVEQYKINFTHKMIKELVQKRILQNIQMYLPQTNEKCICEIVLKDDLSGAVEIKNVKRIKNT